MKIGTKVKALRFPGVENWPGAWRNYADKIGTIHGGCSNDSKMHLVKFSDGNAVYWPNAFISPKK